MDFIEQILQEFPTINKLQTIHIQQGHEIPHSYIRFQIVHAKWIRNGFKFPEF
ncbi:hypothetical protein OIU79_007728 [Salix purpurea]|uniref:Uncharacterized protein n=1 Tax=Salix purpurea TaxID=77065 RepID=A0A9Q0YV95_SALPP|nr:hypothetical protein OIU79_007728 [Salix purpurea]